MIDRQRSMEAANSTGITANESKAKDNTMIDEKIVNYESESVAEQHEDLSLDPKLEAKLLRKLDLTLMPLFGMMFFFSYLDRANIGNAKVAGMTEDLNMSESQFSTASSILYATYITVQIPGVLLMRRFRPNLYLGTMMFIWGMVTVFTVFVQGFGGLCAVRVILGVLEGSFFSCMSVYTSNVYESNELATRFGYLLMAAGISSAFGGLIGTGITKIETGPLERWRYLYLVEGLLTICAAITVMIVLPRDPEILFKKEDEKYAWDIRKKRRAHFMGEKKFDKKWVFQTFTEVKTFTSVIIQFCQDICLYGYTTFLPSILNAMGFNSLESQYMTIPAYAVACISLFVSTYLSDKYRIRSPFIITLDIVAIIGYVIILTVDKNGVKYFGCFLIATALISSVGLNESWIATNSAPADKRATSIGANQTIGNAAGIVAPQVYRKSPYLLGHLFTIGVFGVAIITTACQAYMFYKINQRKDRESNMIEDEEAEKAKGDRSARFKFIM